MGPLNNLFESVLAHLQMRLLSYLTLGELFLQGSSSLLLVPITPFPWEHADSCDFLVSERTNSFWGRKKIETVKSREWGGKKT